MTNYVQQYDNNTSLYMYMYWIGYIIAFWIYDIKK